MKKEYLYIVAFLLIASGLHFYYTPLPSLWIDESMVVNLSHLSNGQLMDNLLTFQAHPPSFYFLIKSWRILFGDSESALRSLSFVFFLLTVVATYFFAKELFGERVARFSLVFSSTSHFLIFFSHQLRPYEMLAFLGVASFYFFTKMLKKFGLKPALGYLFFSVLGLYTHFWFVLAFLAQGLIILAIRRSIEFKKVFSVMVLAGLFFLPWGIIFLRTFRSSYTSEWLLKSDLNMLWQSARFLLWGQALPVLSVTAIVLITIVFGKKLPAIDKTGAAILFSYLLIPIISAYIISKFLPIYTPGRREMLVTPAFTVLLAFVFSQLNFKKWFALASILLTVFVSQAIADSNVMMAGYKSNDKKILNGVFEKIHSGDVVILSGFSSANFDYYWERYNKERPEKRIEKIYIPAEGEQNAMDLELIRKLANDKNKFNEVLNNAANKIEGMKPGNIYLFLSDPRMIDDMVKFFDGRYKMVGEVMPELPNPPTYINGVLIYSR
jgi:hypothetical protein